VGTALEVESVMKVGEEEGEEEEDEE
jgi:hypothetical protein